MNEQDFAALLRALGLPGEATVQDVLKAIESLKETSSAENDVKESLSLAYKAGIISKAECSEMEELFNGNPLKLAKYLNIRKQEKQKENERKFELFVRDNKQKFRTYSHDFIHGEMKQFALKDLETFSKMIEKAPDLILPTDIIYGSSRGRRANITLKSEWNLEDYRKNAPQELRKNPDLYKELLEKENNRNNQ